MVTKNACDYWIPAFAGMTKWSFVVMAGLDPAIHALDEETQDVDARVKPGHDEGILISRGK